MNKKIKVYSKKKYKTLLQNKLLWKPECLEENHLTKYYITKLVDLVLDAN